MIIFLMLDCQPYIHDIAWSYDYAYTCIIKVTYKSSLENINFVFVASADKPILTLTARGATLFVRIWRM